MLIAFGGLPGTGKSTIATLLASRLAATYLRIDTIEQAIRDACPGAVGPEGYLVAYALAETNLRLGRTVVTDAVNPLPVTRAAFRDVAARVGCAMLEVECVCGDKNEHRRRVETRITEVSGLRLPDWEDVVGRDYQPWPEPHLIFDTARLAAVTIADQICALVVPR